MCKRYKKIKSEDTMKSLKTAFIILFSSVILTGTAFAHCDGEDGPVVTAAKKALDEKNVNLALIWVQKDDEKSIVDAYNKTLSVRELNPSAKELADKYFFETLVRIHRMGEGAPFTGVKPAGFNNDPSVLQADKTIETSSLKELYVLLTEQVHNGLHNAYEKVESLKNYDKDNVEEGREYVAAYVNFLHYAEGIYKAAGKTEHSHEHTENHQE